jgi:hypothetical protein
MVLDYDKLVKFKKNLLNTLNNRIANLKSFINTLTDKNKVKENTKLLEELQERANVLDQEIYNEKNAGETSLQKLKFQAERDLQRLDRLLNPNEGLTDDYENLQEARKILNFYKALELVRNKVDVDNNAFSVHPFFNIEEILGPDGNPILSDEVAAVFNNIAAEFKKREKPYNDRQKVLLERIINSNPKVREIIGEKSYDELMENLDDASYVDMWMMEANRGIFSKNGNTLASIKLNVLIFSNLLSGVPAFESPVIENTFSYFIFLRSLLLNIILILSLPSPLNAYLFSIKS